MRKSKILKSTVISIICAASFAGVANADVAKPIVAPAGDLVTALEFISKQADIELVFRPEQLKGLQTKGVSGALTAQEAVRKLLEGTQLQLSEDARTGAMMIGLAVTSRVVEKPTQRPSQAAYLRIAQSSSETTRQEVGREIVGTQAATEDDVPSSKAVVELEEVLVTGSHIRGVQNLSSPIIELDRADIDASGYATTQELIRSLPQNLGNVSELTQGGVNGGAGQALTYEGAGINLRGMGSDSTLVLLDGRRLAAAGNGSFVDISLIPLSAVDRVEVLTDGASAIYGSDAVGGVVNFRLRKDFDGAETRVRYGTVTQGAHDHVQAGQMLGHTWDSGHALLSYEYFGQSRLAGSDRSFFQPVEFMQDIELVPEQKRHGALAVLSQRLNERIELASQLAFGDRKSSSAYAQGEPYNYFYDAAGKQLGASVGISVDFFNRWQARLTGLWDRNQSELATFVASTRELEQLLPTEGNVWSVDLAADGPLLEVGGGSVRFALGGQFRKERFEDLSESNPANIERNVSAVYAEVVMPWVGSANRRRGLERLELSMSGRFEDYSDFGSSFNPKFGLSWAPMSALNVRATWGTSFRAPLLSQMNPRIATTIYEAFFVDETGPVPALMLNGRGVENLGPQESTNLSAGIDFAPKSIEGLETSVTYFEIDYERRISSPIAGVSLAHVMLDPNLSFIVTRNPDPAHVADLFERGSGSCFTASFDRCSSIPEVAGIVDVRARNLARLFTKGIDYSVEYQWDTGLGNWLWQLGGTKLLENRQRVIPGMPDTELLNDVWQPADLRLRSGLSFSAEAISASVFINYTDGYTDRRPESMAGPLQRSNVSSWSTVDLSLQYRLGRLPVGSATLSLSAINVLDRDPPFVANTYGLYFDGANASPVGRFIGAQLTVNW